MRRHSFDVMNLNFSCSASEKMMGFLTNDGIQYVEDVETLDSSVILAGKRSAVQSGTDNADRCHEYVGFPDGPRINEREFGMPH